MNNIIILGGGAASCATAIRIKKDCPKAKITIIEKSNELLKKLSATGNGKCNISNISCEDWPETEEFFRTIGVFTKADDQGRIYPISESAKDVQWALIDFLRRNNVDVILNSEVIDVINENNEFVIITAKKKYKSKILVVGVGGKAAPQFATVGDGYKLAKKLGHTVSKTAPILTGIRSKETKNIGNVRAKGDVYLYKKGELVKKETGEIQFSKDGISGICVFNISRYLLLDEKTRFSDYEIGIDFLPDLSEKDVADCINTISANCGSVRPLLSLVNEKIGNVICEKYPKAEFNKALKDFRVNVVGAMGWDRAQCTKGGVVLNELTDDFQSRLVPNLYFVGEILDLDGPCGGYNLQIAWSTAKKVGEKICIEYIK